MNFLFDLIETYNFNLIGFDLDGTLYDEFDFIIQAYKKICSELSLNNVILDFMLLRWLEEGSSYPYIFSETGKKFKLSNDFEVKALNIFRNISPKLTISNRVKFILDKLEESKLLKLFLLTDGHKELQIKKIQSLNIEKYFNEIIITNDKPKPDPFHGTFLLEKYKSTPDKVLYIGDREVDMLFCQNIKIKFLNIRKVLC